MADVYGPFATASWSDGEWSRFAPTWVSSGPILPHGSAVPTSATTGEWAFSNSGLSVSAAAGRAWVRGFGITRTGTPPSHAVTANTHASWSRRDRLVLRRDLAAATVTTAVKIGTAAATPTAPGLTQTETGVWEETLFSFLTPPASGTSITGIVDERKWVAPSGGGSVVKPDPTLPTEYATKGYVDTTVGGYNPNRMMRGQRETDTAFPNDAWTQFTSDTNWSGPDTYNMRASGATVVPGAGAGYYQISAGVHFAENTTGVRAIRLDPNAGANIGSGTGSALYLAATEAVNGMGTPLSGTSPPVFLDSGDTVQLGAYQNSGASLIIARVWISAIYLGPNA